jgi:hypothetical protein
MVSVELSDDRVKTSVKRISIHSIFMAARLSGPFFSIPEIPPKVGDV